MKDMQEFMNFVCTVSQLGQPTVCTGTINESGIVSASDMYLPLFLQGC